MKNLVIALTLLVASVSAKATSLHPETFTLRADLVHIQMDPASKKEVRSAQVEVNEQLNVVRLRLFLKSNCPAGRICAAVVPTETIELPLIEKKETGCGVHILARQDKRPVDGALNEIQIRSMSYPGYRPLCRIALRPDRDTAVRYNVKFYNRIEHKEVELSHYLVGYPLK